MLSEKGVEQAKATGNELADVKFAVAFVSPLKRAQKTFDYINEYHNLTPIIDKRIQERNFGELEGKSCGEDSLVKKADMYNFNLNSDFGYGIEKIEDTHKRVKSFIDEVLNKYEDKNILVVAHGAIGRHFEAYFHGIPEDGIILKGPNNAEVRIYQTNV
jgi:alpha-ribazole phosphatase/probable phosphoglycerate mutase